MKSALTWVVGSSKECHLSPAEWCAATVPGAVQLDYARAHQWPEYWYGDNFKNYGWMEDVYWHYQAKLEFDALSADKRLFFVCKGIDYRFEIRLQGQVLHAQEGMFTPVELDLTGQANPGDLLEIVVWPAPKIPGKSADRTQAAESCKPAVSYGWDWHPRLIPLGIWDECYLETRPKQHIQDSEIRYVLSEDLQLAKLTLELQTSPGTTAQCRWVVTDPAQKTVIDQTAPCTGSVMQLVAELKNPALWWPQEQGLQNLYRVSVELLSAQGAVVDRRQFRLGIRRVRLVMHPTQWSHPGDFPKSRSFPPITLEINNRSIFAKGSNWVNPEIFPGTITAETYRPLLKLAQEAHFNLLRVWGGGIVNKESFFELCDEMGLMVWQEFPLACNNYPDLPEYLAVLDKESRSIIKRLRRHPSLALWCGGNELFNGWSGMTDQSHALRLLNANCFQLDPQTPFIPTSPIDGMAHGCYLFRYHDGREVFQVMPSAAYTAYTEFGVPGPSPVEYLKTFIPAGELFPPKPQTAWETHHAFGAWLGSTWLELPLIEEYFGPSPDLETLVARGAWLQSAGYQCIFEEARRQKPYCAMALNWCYNEPWPSAANNSLINWPAQPKAAYHAVAESCRPTLASARIPKFRWREGEAFTPELWLLHDAPTGLPAGTLQACLRVGDQEIPLLNWDFSPVPANTNLAGPTIRFMLPHLEGDRIILVLRIKDHPEWTSQYPLHYTPTSTRPEENKPTVLNL